MTKKLSLWVVFIGLVSLFVFTFQAARSYFSNPAEIPLTPVVLAIIALLMVVGAWIFRVKAEAKRKNDIASRH